MSDLVEARQRFAEEIKYRAQITSSRLLRAFATVPRERFLGEGPWKIRSEVALDYWSTVSVDPVHLYHDVLVAIDEGRELDNGLPSLWARVFDCLNISEEDHVFQIGCGVGYYTAILSEVVGPNGRVTAIECDEYLVRVARANLQERSNVDVIYGNGCCNKGTPVKADAIVVHAGATHPQPFWLDMMRPNGRLQLPLTTDDHQGTLFIIKRLKTGYEAKAIRRVAIYHCEGGRSVDADPQLLFWKQAAACVNSLRRDAHEENESCWLHGEGFCLSKKRV